MKINELNLELEFVSADTIVEYDGIEFFNSCFIRAQIDGEYIHYKEDFKDCVIVLDELKASINNDGDFLIFVGVSGIADDDGWQKVKVTHTENTVSWSISRLSQYTFCFDRNNYSFEIKKVFRQYDQEGLSYELEPTTLIEPE